MLEKNENSNDGKLCSLQYVSSIMGGKPALIHQIIETSIIQITEEQLGIGIAISQKNYTTIANIAHSMKSSVSIMGIESLTPILQEMENLGTKAVTGSTSLTTSIERMNQLLLQLNSICDKALEELEREKQNFIV